MQLALDLEAATNELLEAAEADLDRVERLIACRSAVLTRLEKTDPASFSPDDLSRLRGALRNGESALEKLTFLRRDTAAEWQRCNRIHYPETDPVVSLSLSA